MTGRDPSGQALAVPATPANAVDGPSGFDPSRIAEAVELVEPKLLAPIIKRAADEFYNAVLDTAEDYLRENLDWNISSHISMLERENQRMRTELFEVDKSLGCMSLGQEARLSAIRETQQRFNQASAEAWRLRGELAQAIEAQRAATGNTDAVEDESAVANGDAPENKAVDPYALGGGK